MGICVIPSDKCFAVFQWPSGLAQALPGWGPQCLSQMNGRCRKTTFPRAAWVSLPLTLWAPVASGNLHIHSYYWSDTRYRYLDVPHSFFHGFIHSFTSIHLHPLCAGHLGEAPRTQLALTSSEADAPKMTHTQWITTSAPAKLGEESTETEQDRSLIWVRGKTSLIKWRLAWKLKDQKKSSRPRR